MKCSCIGVMSMPGSLSTRQAHKPLQLALAHGVLSTSTSTTTTQTPDRGCNGGISRTNGCASPPGQSRISLSFGPIVTLAFDAVPRSVQGHTFPAGMRRTGRWPLCLCVGECQVQDQVQGKAELLEIFRILCNFIVRIIRKYFINFLISHSHLSIPPNPLQLLCAG